MLTALAPIHPRFVHLPSPCASWAHFIALGLIQQQQTLIGYGQFSLLLGWLGVMVAIITGLIDQSGAPDEAAIQAVINLHITVGIALMIAVGLTLYWPLRNKRLFGRAAHDGDFWRCYCSSSPWLRSEAGWAGNWFISTGCGVQ